MGEIINYCAIAATDTISLSVYIGNAQPAALTSVLINDVPVTNEHSNSDGFFQGDFTVALGKGSDLITKGIDVKTMLQPLNNLPSGTTAFVRVEINNNGNITTYPSVLMSTVVNTANYLLTIIFVTA